MDRARPGRKQEAASSGRVEPGDTESWAVEGGDKGPDPEPGGPLLLSAALFPVTWGSGQAHTCACGTAWPLRFSELPGHPGSPTGHSGAPALVPGKVPAAEGASSAHPQLRPLLEIVPLTLQVVARPQMPPGLSFQTRALRPGCECPEQVCLLMTCRQTSQGPRCPPTRRPTEGQAWPPSLTLHLILTPPRAHRGHSAGRSGLMSPHGPLACGSDWMSAPAAHSLPPGRRPGARDSHRLLPPGPGPAKVRRRVGGGGMTPRGSPSRVSSGLLAVGHFTQE